MANKISDYYKVAEDLNKALTLDLILIFISINKPVIVDAFAYLFKLWIHSDRFLLLLNKDLAILAILPKFSEISDFR